nr:hypothetical protein [Tanacetum cinerariifolium]
ISTQVDRAQSSQVLVPLPKDPYEAIRQAYLVGTDTESEPYEEAEAMSDSAFRKRFRSSYDSLPSLTLLVRKKYREDEGPTTEDEDPAIGDKGLATGDEGLGIGFESHGLDDEVHMVESDGFGLGEEEAVPEGQQRVVLIVGTATDPEDCMVYINVPAYPPPAPSAQTSPSPKWSSGSLLISPAPSIIPSPIPSTMISLNVPSPIALPVATSTATILVDEDQFIERYQFRSPKHKQERTAVKFIALWRPVLALEAWEGRADTRMTYMSRAGCDDHRLVHDMLLQRTALH